MANTKVTGDVIANGTISTVHLADDAITAAKLDSTATGITFADLTVDTNTLYVDAANNSVGIGTTSPANAVSGLHIATNQSTDQLYLERTNGATGRYYLGTASNSFYIVDDAQSATRMVIDSSGNVGIGTASPATKLHVMGTIKLGGYSFIGEDLSDLDSLTIASDHTESIHFAHHNSGTYTTNMIIDSSGNVGIGTSSPSQLLNLSGNTNSFSTAPLIRFDSTSTASANIRNWAIGPADSYYGNFHIYKSSTRGGDPVGTTQASTFTIDYNGNVGIGTSTPEANAKLDVRAGSGGKIVLGSYDANYKVVVEAGDQLNFYNGSSAATAYINYGFTGTPGNILLSRNLFVEANSSGGTSGTVRIKSDGNVGIGTTSPAYKLEVAGTIGTEGRLAAQQTYFGYSTSYKVVQFGNAAATSGISLGYNPIGNTNGGFSGNEILIPNNIRILAPNAADNLFYGVMMFDSNDKLLIGSSNYLIENNYIMALDPTTKNVGIATSSPTQKLDVVGIIKSSGVSNSLMFSDRSTASNTWEWYSSGNNAGLYKNHNTAGTVMTIDSSGNVGIGVTSPGAKLHIVEGNNYAQLGDLQGNSTMSLRMADNAASPIEVQAYGTELRFNTSTTSGATPSVKMNITSAGNVGIGNIVASAKLQIHNTNAGAGAVAAYLVNASTSVNTETRLAFAAHTNDDIATNRYSYISTINTSGSNGQDMTFATNPTGSAASERMRITSGGKALIGITSEQNAGKVQIQSGGSENGGILDIASGGWYRYYTRVCRNATSVSQAGYWHIKTNIAANSNTMFLAKFYGYIYGSAQVLDLTHAGYAYSATSTVINQGTTNNGSDPNASSAIYISANGSKVTFRIAFGTGSNFSTYFAGVFMDIAFPNPAGQGHDFEIEAQSFSTNTTLY
jgi:hypothetical protein